MLSKENKERLGHALHRSNDADFFVITLQRNLAGTQHQLDGALVEQRQRQNELDSLLKELSPSGNVVAMPLEIRTIVNLTAPIPSDPQASEPVDPDANLLESGLLTADEVRENEARLAELPLKEAGKSPKKGT